MQSAREDGYPEVKAYGIAIVGFGLLHLANVFLGAPLGSAAMQMLTTMIIGTGFYCLPRLTRRLWVPSAVHGCWDFLLGVIQH